MEGEQTEMTWNPNGGKHNPAHVEWIAAHLVSERMIDRAIIANEGCGPKAAARLARTIEDPIRRAQTRHNIAIGIECGSYPLRED